MRTSGLDFEGFTNKTKDLAEESAVEQPKESLDPNIESKPQLNIEEDNIPKAKDEEEEKRNEENSNLINFEKKNQIEKEKKDADLNFTVHHSGSNLSNGEKQIINFLRIMLRDSEIICLDEATSNMDPQSGFLLNF